jgi:vitamin B12 transporter
VGSAIAAVSCAGASLPEVTFAQSPAQRPDEIIVTSSLIPTPRRQIGTAVSVLEGAEIELRGYASLAEVLRTQPGIGVSNSGGLGKSTTLRIRGEEGYRTLLMIDGVKAVDPSAPQPGPSFDSLLTTSDMERVEVLRGPQGFIYGADAGGVVNIITGRGMGGFGGRVGLEVGEFDTQKIEGSLSGGNDAGDFFVSVADLDTDGFNARVDDTQLRDDDGAENTTLHTKLGWNATDSLRLQLVARDIDASTMYDGCFPPSNNCVGTTEQTTYKVSAEHRTDTFSNSFGYSNVDIVLDNLTNGVSAFATDGNLSRLEYTGSYRPSEALTLVYGVDLQDEEVVGGGAVLDRGQDGYYAEYQGNYGGNFFLSLGARYDDNDDFGSHTSSRLTLAYIQDLNGGNSVKYRASYGTGFRAPSLFEIAYNDGPFAFPPAAGLALSEEESEGYDLGIEYDAANGLHFEITYFDQELTNEIFFDLTAFSGYLQSIGTSNSDGVELGLTAPLGERWEILANWTNNDATDTTNTQRLRRPENVANFGVAYTSITEALRFIANYRLARDAVDADSVTFVDIVPLDDYEVLDLSIAYQLNDAFELYGRVQNATDEDYQEVDGYNTAGRAAYGGVRLRF